jgi:hypothetical protein
VLVVGGSNSSGTVHAAERYDPARGRWSRAGNSSTRGIAAVLLDTGHVLVVGGPAAELYDPATNRWAPTGSLTSVHGGPAVVLQDGRVLMAGAGTGDVYSPATGTWAATGPMVFPYASAAGALLRNGQVLYAGGVDSPCQKFGGCQPWPTPSCTRPSNRAVHALVTRTQARRSPPWQGGAPAFRHIPRAGALCPRLLTLFDA